MEEASAPIEAVPIIIDIPTNDAEPEINNEKMDHPTAEQESHDDRSNDTMDGDTQGMIIFTIDQTGSLVSFTLDELLRNVPTTVVGSTNQVAGEIVIDIENPEKSQIGTILVNARTLTTDNNFRNRAINNEILKTGDYEFITFAPTKISGIPEGSHFGDELSVQITGDLTIRDVTKVITFDALIIVTSEKQMSGFASAIVERSDFNLKIPEVPGVVNVDNEVLLEIEFSAAAE